MEEKEKINIADFSKTQLQVGEILSAEKVESGDKLLKFQVSIGEKQIQVLSGIAEYYSPEDLIGFKVVVVTNLEPITLRGELSEGMLLCAKEEDKIILIKLSDNLIAGSFIS